MFCLQVIQYMHIVQYAHLYHGFSNDLVTYWCNFLMGNQMLSFWSLEWWGYLYLLYWSNYWWYSKVPNAWSYAQPKNSHENNNHYKKFECKFKHLTSNSKTQEWGSQIFQDLKNFFNRFSKLRKAKILKGFQFTLS